MASSRANLSDKPRIGLLGSFAASYMKEIASEEDQSLVVSQEVKQMHPKGYLRYLA